MVLSAEKIRRSYSCHESHGNIIIITIIIIIDFACRLRGQQHGILTIFPSDMCSICQISAKKAEPRGSE